MVWIEINGVQHVTYPSVLLPGDSYTVDITGPAAASPTVSLKLGAGRYDESNNKVVYWWWTETVVWNTSNNGNNNNNAETVYVCTDPSVQKLLTEFSSIRTYTGQYWTFNPVQVHTASFTFRYPSGEWTLASDGNNIGSGSVTLVDWPTLSLIIKWTIDTSNPEQNMVNWSYPWGCFKMRNGPEDWPIIEYCRTA